MPLPSQLEPRRDEFRDAIRLNEFVRESNRIEGIDREPHPSEHAAHAVFLSLQTVTVADMEAFVRDIAAVPLRRAPGQDVRVGAHRPPPGGPAIEHGLRRILATANTLGRTAFQVHCEYESLHPFLDGNGRSGRALWAWMMRKEGHDPFALPFLHRWYYQSLDVERVML